jgi:hypothetical protein
VAGFFIWSAAAPHFGSFTMVARKKKKNPGKGDANAEVPPTFSSVRGPTSTKQPCDEQGRSPTELRLALKRAGYAPIPLNGKAPVLPDWPQMLDVPDATIRNWANGNTGLLAKFTPSLDIDIRHTEAALAIEAKVREQFGSRGKILVRIGEAPKRLIPFRTDVPFEKITRPLFAPWETTPKRREQRLEILADGQQFVAAGIHPDVHGPYTWTPPLWTPEQTVSHDELPPITQAEAIAFIDMCVDFLVANYGYQVRAGLSGNGGAAEHVSGEELTAPAYMVAAAVALIPNPDLPEEDWVKIGLAICAATNGSDVGKAIFEQWSAKAGKNVKATTAKRWRNFLRSPPDRIGYGTLHHQASQVYPNWEDEWAFNSNGAIAKQIWEFSLACGVATVDEGVEAEDPIETARRLELMNWGRPSTDQQQDEGGPQTAANAQTTLDQGQPTTASGQPLDEHGIPLVPLSFEHWDLRVLPNPVFLCGKWLTDVSRTLLTADTGIGKTMWAIALAMAMATGKPFLHWQCPQASKVLLVDGEMARKTLQQWLRLARDRLGCTPANLYILSHEDLEETWQPLNTKEGQLIIERQIKLIAPNCIIFDNVMSLISGDQKDEEGWAQVMPWVYSLTRRNIAQVWLHHTGHDTSRSYGTKTREWQMNNHLHFTKVESNRDLCFDLTFRKHRDRSPETRADFADGQVSLVENQWAWSPTEQGSQRRKLTHREEKFYAALCLATAQSGMQEYGCPAATLEAWKSTCINQGLLTPDDHGHLDGRARAKFSECKEQLVIKNWVANNATLAWTLGPNSRAIL